MQKGLSVPDRIYWPLRNGSAMLVWIVVMPIYIALFVFEALVDAIRSLDGSCTLEYPWQSEWPFWRDE